MIAKEKLEPSFENADKLFFDNLEEIFDFMGDQRTTEREVLKGGRHFLGDFLDGRTILLTQQMQWRTSWEG
eukprot:COSAG02_NODE_965_length_15584_cov_21.604312_18_plen_71_part_00